MLRDIFKIISFYDEVRWSSTSNYNLINYYRENLTDETKLLTHWLCYISDRQMSFARIWDVGGFVFSELADNFRKAENLQFLNPENEKAFITKNGNGFAFKSNSKVLDNKKLKQSYYFKESDYVKFIPRYYPSDYFSILYTLDTLQHFDNCLVKFIVNQLEKFSHTDDYIKRLLFSLYLLTYFEIKQPQKAELSNFSKNIDKAAKRTETVLTILNNQNIFEIEYGKFRKDRIFYQKRAWCSLRDFLKSPEFKEHLLNSLKRMNVNESLIEQIFSLKSLKQFELPGDVWNNNSKFRNCILENTEYKSSKKSLNKILRDYYDKNEQELNDCYPEQFDISFDFVPRMCESDNCDICPIGKLKSNPNSQFEKTCVNNKNLYCSVSLINCNYKINCYGSDCKLKKYNA